VSFPLLPAPCSPASFHQLPITPETLFLRILGRGKVQRQAVEELEILANNSPFLADIIKLVHDLIAVLSARQRKEQDIDKDDQELIMKLSEIYQQQLEELKKQGRQEGRQEGLQEGIHVGLQEGRQEGLQTGVERERRAMIESILQVRFGQIDSQLQTIINPLIAMSREEFTPLLLQLSREELLAKFA
jgi:flagellar biosynthesis/type III secretory pathway protein FliH